MRRGWAVAVAWMVAVGAGLVAGDAAARAGTSRAARERRISQHRSVLADVARAAMPAVVSITTQEKPDASGEPQKGIGSGFIVSSDGYVLTAAHVVEDSKDFTVTLLDARGFPEEVPARLIGIDAPTDCALLKVDVARRLPTLKLGSADGIELADWVVVIGSPYGLDHSVSVGVISAKGRTDIVPGGRTGVVDFLQTDAAINPGNSGGPMLDVDGQVVGIANAVNTTGQGIGFAIPADVARAVVDELRLHGRVRRGWLGLSVVDMTPDVARGLGVPSYSGVLVSEVVAGSPAQRAGLREGDVILGVDRTRIQRAQALRWRVAQAGLGTPVRIEVARRGAPVWVSVMPEETPTVAAAPKLSLPAVQPAGTGGSGD